MPERTAKANGRKSKERSAVEHVFARQKGPMGLVIPTIGIARARTKIGLANLVYSMKRILWRPDKPLRREQNTRSGDAIISLIGQSQDESAEHIENRAIPQSCANRVRLLEVFTCLQAIVWLFHQRRCLANGQMR
jgi:hypothetical protein